MPRTVFEVRLRHVQRFYEILDKLERSVGGKRTLETADGGMNWPQRGVYFFFESGEVRTLSGTGLRVTRVGTHALKAGSKSTLWGRLRMHRGTMAGSNPGGGNHRGSVFRLHVGTALIRRDDWSTTVTSDWGVGSSAKRDVRNHERPLERAVSQHIRCMPFLWAGIEDEPGPASLRGYIERNAIALLSNHSRQDAPIDRPSSEWLGQWAASEHIQRSGLWNVNHVGEEYDPDFLDVLEQQVVSMAPRNPEHSR
jgi:hypothetical protein